MHACSFVCACVFWPYIFTWLLTALKAAYEEAHRSDGGLDLQNLDYCMKKQTDDITNIVNG